MAKRTVTVTFKGKTFKRQTDRPYSHALVLTRFNPDVARRSDASYEADWVKQDARNIKWHREMAALGAGGTIHVTGCARPWSYDQSAADHAKHVARLGDKTDAQLMAECVAQRAAATEKRIAELTARGNDVLSWHGSLALALKAAAAVPKSHPAFSVEIVPVNAA